MTQSLRSKVSQCFSDRSGADLENLGDVVLHETCSTGQLTVEDRATHSLTDVDVCRLPSTSDDRVGDVVLGNRALENFQRVGHKPRSLARH